LSRFSSHPTRECRVSTLKWGTTTSFQILTY
jgi:hypothetical protein